MWGARGSFPPAAAMVVMVAVGSWSLGHASTVGIVYVFYGINLFFGINIYAGIKSIRPVRTGPIKFILFVQADRGFATSQLCTDEDGTIVHTNII
jgi:hypothetical protein